MRCYWKEVPPQQCLVWDHPRLTQRKWRFIPPPTFYDTNIKAEVYKNGYGEIRYATCEDWSKSTSAKSVEKAMVAAEQITRKEAI